MTLEITIAEASSGPKRRSSEAWCGRFTSPSLGDQLSGDGKCADALPLHRPVLREQLDVRVHEIAVLQHLFAALGAGVAELRSDGQRRRLRARREAARAGRSEQA